MILVEYRPHHNSETYRYYVPEYQIKAAKRLVNYYTSQGFQARWSIVEDKEPGFNWRKDFTQL